MIVLDTSVLSLAFRRRSQSQPEPAVARTLRRLIIEDRPVTIPGIVLQEVLSGVRTPEQFNKLAALLEGFPILIASSSDHIAAAQLANSCRRAGIAVTAIDCLIAALTTASDAWLFTVDDDFERIASCCGLKLFRHADYQDGGTPSAHPRRK